MEHFAPGELNLDRLFKVCKMHPGGVMLLVCLHSSIADHGLLMAYR